MGIKLDFICTSGPHGDQCCSYKVIPSKPITLRELIDHVRLERKYEWGDISVSNNPGPRGWDNFEEVCKYSRETTEIEVTNQEYLDKYSDTILDSITAYGGWSLMHYSAIVSK